MAMNIFGMSKEKTSKVNKRFNKGTTNRYSLYKATEATVGPNEDIKAMVKCPDDEELNDFYANHVVDFYTRAKLVYSTVMDSDLPGGGRICTTESCPSMTGGPKYEYLWQDEGKKPETLPAPEYVMALMQWIDDILTDERIFPPVDDVPFPKNFKKVCSKIFRRLYRIFVHVYIEHFTRLQEIGAEAHTNTFYKHFYYFVKEHDMMEDKDFAPLETLTRRLCKDWQIPILNIV